MVERLSESYSWVTYLFLFVFVAMVALQQINTHRFSEFLKLGWSQAYIKQTFQSAKREWYFNLALLFISFSSMSFIATIFFARKETVNKEVDFDQFWKVVIAMLVFFSIKYILQKVIGYVFEVSKTIRYYLVFKSSYLFYIGFIMFIPALLLIYSSVSTLVISAMVAILLFFYVASIVKLFFKLRSEISKHLFYYILYICSFEIIPFYFVVWYIL